MKQREVTQDLRCTSEGKGSNGGLAQSAQSAQKKMATFYFKFDLQGYIQFLDLHYKPHTTVLLGSQMKNIVGLSFLLAFEFFTLQSPIQKYERNVHVYFNLSSLKKYLSQTLLFLGSRFR